MSVKLVKWKYLPWDKQILSSLNIFSLLLTPVTVLLGLNLYFTQYCCLYITTMNETFLRHL